MATDYVCSKFERFIARNKLIVSVLAAYRRCVEKTVMCDKTYA